MSDVERFPRRCEMCGLMRQLVADGDGWAMLPCAGGCIGSVGDSLMVPLRDRAGNTLTEMFKRVATPTGYAWRAMGCGPVPK